MKGRDPEFRCVYCGKYVSYIDIQDKKVAVEFTPDSEFTTEKFEMYHVKCQNKE